MVDSNVPGITIYEKHWKYYHLNYIYFKIVLLRKYTLLPATVSVLQTFLEAILWKYFQLFRRILKDINSITKAPSL
jgi:hypothetical protein